MQQHRNIHCVHTSVAANEWWQFTEVTKLCLLHLICESCDLKFASGYIASVVLI